MEENKIEVLVNEQIPHDFNSLKNLFKQAFGNDFSGEVEIIKDGEQIPIDEKNYQNYVYSLFQLSQTKKKNVLNITERDSEMNVNYEQLSKKHEEMKKLVKKNINDKNELKKQLKTLEESKKELEKKNDEEKNQIFEEIEIKHKQFDQKCKIIDNFQNFKKFMDEESDYKEKIENINKN